MRFDLDEQQQFFQQAVADYLRAECPINRALEPHDTQAADYSLWSGLMELGIGGVMVPEEYGGLGLGLLDMAVVAEPIGRYAMPGPFIEHALATLAITLGGADEHKEKWLSALSVGELRATIALSEEKGSWTADAWNISPDGNTITGSKRFVLHAEGADLIVVGLAGGRFGVVEKDVPGITLTSMPSNDAGKQLHHVSFDGTPVTLLPEAVGERVVDAGMVLLAADAFGGASQSVSMAVEYAKEREQFGQPVGSFQGLKHQLAEMALEVEPAVGLYWYAAYQFDLGSEEAGQMAALAKSHITEVYPKISRRMIEAHGGIGYTWEFGAHVWLKRALFDQAYLGMPQLHRTRYAGMAGW